MKKKYTVHWDDDQVASVEIDGVRYENPHDIPDERDRARVKRLLAGAPKPEAPRAAGGPSAFKYIFLVFPAVAVLMLVIAVLTGVATARAQAREESAPGVVVDVVARQASNGQEYYYPVVEFALPDAGVRTVQLGEGSWPPAYEGGEHVTVLYNPERPLEARIKSAGGTLTLWTWTIVTGILAVAFGLASLFVRWIFSFDAAPPSGEDWEDFDWVKEEA